MLGAWTVALNLTPIRWCLSWTQRITCIAEGHWSRPESHRTEWQRVNTNTLTSGTRAGWPITLQLQLNAQCKPGSWEKMRRTWFPARPPACRLRWKVRRSTDTTFITAVAKRLPRLSEGHSSHTNHAWTPGHPHSLTAVVQLLSVLLMFTHSLSITMKRRCFYLNSERNRGRESWDMVQLLRVKWVRTVGWVVPNGTMELSFFFVFLRFWWTALWLTGLMNSCGWSGDKLWRYNGVWFRNVNVCFFTLLF